jgi:LmbE family N-acetylglucosaminyl deacetylase
MIEWIPRLDSQRPLRVLCLGAHPDDIEIGCGGALLELAGKSQPLEIRWVVFSGGRTRSKEARASAGHWLGAVPEKTIDLHDFRDGFFPDEWVGIKTVFEQLKESFEPDLLFSHFRDDLHQDHRIVNELTWNTFRNHCILEYEIPKYDGDLGVPNFYVPVSAETATAKAGALTEFFGSQQAKHWFSEELFLGLMRIRGMEAGSPSGYAEGFHARKTCAQL